MNPSGLASLLLGMTVQICVPLTLILAAAAWAFADRSPGVVSFHVWLARIGVVPPGLLAVLGLWLGIRGLKDRSTGSALPVAGIALSAAALVGWVIAAVVLLNTTEGMVK